MPAPGRADLVVYGAGLAQGLVLVSFPAAEPVLRGSDGFGLGATAYGLLFAPQVVLAIVTSVLGGALSHRLGLRRVLVVGLGCDGMAMALFAAAALTLLLGAGRPVSYAVLLAATAFLGAGFGLTVPTLNSLAADLHPGAADRALLTLNALLGLGTALAPVLSAVVLGLGVWWALPLLAMGLVDVLSYAAARTAFDTPADRPSPLGAVLRARTFWLVAAAALLYGVVETMAGNWTEPLARQSLALSSGVAATMLALFWASVTVGRVVFAVTGLPDRLVYRVLPWVVALALGLVAVLPSGAAVGGVGVSVLAGLGCSALLPLTVGYGQRAFPAEAAALSGLVVGAYQVGYGVAAFGVGPLGAAGVSLSAAFGGAAVVAVVLAGGAVLVSRA